AFCSLSSFCSSSRSCCFRSAISCSLPLADCACACEAATAPARPSAAVASFILSTTPTPFWIKLSSSDREHGSFDGWPQSLVTPPPPFPLMQIGRSRELKDDNHNSRKASLDPSNPVRPAFLGPRTGRGRGAQYQAGCPSIASRTRL